MSTNLRLDEAREIVMRLPVEDQLQLIEEMASALGRDVKALQPSKPALIEHWGKALNQFVDSLDMRDWEALDIDDPVEWLAQQREAERKQRLGDWGES
jgi:hypothetical protein